MVATTWSSSIYDIAKLPLLLNSLHHTNEFWCNLASREEVGVGGWAYKASDFDTVDCLHLPKLHQTLTIHVADQKTHMNFFWKCQVCCFETDRQVILLLRCEDVKSSDLLTELLKLNWFAWKTAKQPQLCITAGFSLHVALSFSGYRRWWGRYPLRLAWVTTAPGSWKSLSGWQCKPVTTGRKTS